MRWVCNAASRKAACSTCPAHAGALSSTKRHLPLPISNVFPWSRRVNSLLSKSRRHCFQECPLTLMCTSPSRLWWSEGLLSHHVAPAVMLQHWQGDVKTQPGTMVIHGPSRSTQSLWLAVLALPAGMDAPATWGEALYSIVDGPQVSAGWPKLSRRMEGAGGC